MIDRRASSSPWFIDRSIRVNLDSHTETDKRLHYKTLFVVLLNESEKKTEKTWSARARVYRPNVRRA